MDKAVWPFSTLNIEPTDDKEVIKRAYAKLIKFNRPDENPGKFQEIREAYEAALSGYYYFTVEESSDVEPLFPFDPTEAGHEVEDHTEKQSTPLIDEEPATYSSTSIYQNKEAEDEQSEADAAKIYEPQLEQEQEGGNYSFEIFYQEMLPFTEKSPAELRRWLQNIPSLWSINLKQSFGDQLIQQLFLDSPPIHEMDLEVLSEFFGYEELQNPCLQRLREELQNSWRLKNPQKYIPLSKEESASRNRWVICAIIFLIVILAHVVKDTYRRNATSVPTSSVIPQGTFYLIIYEVDGSLKIIHSSQKKSDISPRRVAKESISTFKIPIHVWIKNIDLISRAERISEKKEDANERKYIRTHLEKFAAALETGDKDIVKAAREEFTQILGQVEK